MDLKHARVRADIVRDMLTLVEPVSYEQEAMVILDDRITELEAQRNGLLAACKDALDIMKHISSFPVLRNDVGRLAVDRLEGAIYTGEEAIAKAEEDNNEQSFK